MLRNVSLDGGQKPHYEPLMEGAIRKFNEGQIPALVPSPRLNQSFLLKPSQDRQTLHSSYSTSSLDQRNTTAAASKPKRKYQRRQQKDSELIGHKNISISSSANPQLNSGKAANFNLEQPVSQNTVPMGLKRRHEDGTGSKDNQIATKQPRRTLKPFDNVVVVPMLKRIIDNV